MFSPDSRCYQLACMSLHGTLSAQGDEEHENVIECIAWRRKLLSQYEGALLKELSIAFGMPDPYELI